MVSGSLFEELRHCQETYEESQSCRKRDATATCSSRPQIHASEGRDLRLRRSQQASPRKRRNSLRVLRSHEDCRLGDDEDAKR
jgi:hypothetical protein